MCVSKTAVQAVDADGESEQKVDTFSEQGGGTYKSTSRGSGMEMNR